MAVPLIFLAIGFVGIGLNRAIAYAKAERRALLALLEDPSPAAASALWLKLAAAKLPGWKQRAFAVLRFLVDMTTWPVPEVLEYRDRKRHPDYRPPLFRDTRWGGTKHELTPEYVSRGVRRRSLVTSSTSLFLVITAGMFVTRMSDAVQIQILTWVVLTGTVARQAQDLIAGKFVSLVARRSGLPMLHAYRDLLLAALSDLLTLTLCSVLLLRWEYDQSLHMSWFREQVLAVANGGHVTHLWRAFTESPSAVLVGLASLTFYASLIGPLKRTMATRRSGDELMAAAESALRHGKPDRAQRLYELGRSRTPSVTVLGRVEGLIAVSNGRLDEAWSAARTLVRQHRPKEDLDELRQREDGLFVLQGWCQEVGVLPQPTIVELARDVPVRDSMMACLIAQDFAALVSGSGQGTTVAALEAFLDREAWPLTFSVAFEIDGDLAAATRLLPAADRVTGLDVLWRNQLARTQQAARAGPLQSEDGARRIEEAARSLLADVAGSDATTWPEWQRNAFSRALSVPLVFAETVGLDDELVEALTSTRQLIAGDDGENAQVEVLRNIATTRHRRASHPDP